MEIFLLVCGCVIGLALLMYCGDKFVGAASRIAEITGIPQIIIGATIVSIGTTLPELLVSVMATLMGSADLAVSNAVGSVMANIGLIMGISIFVMPGAIKRGDVWFKGCLMIAVTALAGILSLNGKLAGVEATILITFLVGFFVLDIVGARKHVLGNENKTKTVVKTNEWVKLIAWFALGAVGIALGARLLVSCGSELATKIGISQRIIGLTLVAVGTSLPELATAISAIRRGKALLSIGNIFGANIINISGILAVCTMLSPNGLNVSMSTVAQDIPITLVLMIIAVIPAIVFQRFYRWQGAVMLTIYVGYIGAMLFIK